jgi:hypothetical protein
MMRIRRIARCGFAITAALLSLPALAGPPYITDDPEPTDTGHYEIYFFRRAKTPTRWCARKAAPGSMRG